jgi:hypothetical protein
VKRGPLPPFKFLTLQNLTCSSLRFRPEF